MKPIKIVFFVLFAIFSIVDQAKAQVQSGVFVMPPPEALMQSSLKLKGDWIFHPSRHLSLNDLKNGLAEPAKFAAVPGSFTERHFFNARFQGYHGYGTYVLKIVNPEPTFTRIAMSLRVDSSLRMYLYIPERSAFISVGKVGEPGHSKDSTLPAVADPLFVLPVFDFKEAWLVIHVANFHFSSGSLWRAPEIGSYQHMSRQIEKFSFADHLSMGGIFTMIVYNFLLYLRRRSDRTALLLSFCSLFILLRALAMNPETFDSILPHKTLVTYEITRKIEYGSVLLSLLTYLWFIQSSLRIRLPSHFIGMGVFLSACFTFLVVVSPADVFSNYLWYLDGVAFLFLALILGVLVQAARNRKVGTLIAFMGFTAILLTATYDILVGAGVFDQSVFLLPYGLATLIFFQSQVVAQLFSHTFARAERLSAELKRKIEDRKREIGSIMDEVPLGLCTLSGDTRIDTIYSKKLPLFLGVKQPEGQDITQILCPQNATGSDRHELARSTLKSVMGADSLSYSLNESHLPQACLQDQGEAGERFLELIWNPILDDKDEVERILLTVIDSTESRKLKLQISQRAEEIQAIDALTQMSSQRTAAYFHSTHDLLQKIESTLDTGPGMNADAISKVYLNLHTMKGTARTYGMTRIADSCHRGESVLSILRENAADAAVFDDFKVAFQSIKDAIDFYESIHAKRLGSLAAGDFFTLDRQKFQEHLQLVRSYGADLPHSLTRFVQAIQNSVFQSLHYVLSALIDSTLQGRVKSIDLNAAEEHYLARDLCAALLYHALTRIPGQDTPFSIQLRVKAGIPSLLVEVTPHPTRSHDSQTEWDDAGIVLRQFGGYLNRSSDRGWEIGLPKPCIFVGI